MGGCARKREEKGGGCARKREAAQGREDSRMDLENILQKSHKHILRVLSSVIDTVLIHISVSKR